MDRRRRREQITRDLTVLLRVFDISQQHWEVNERMPGALFVRSLWQQCGTRVGKLWLMSQIHPSPVFLKKMLWEHSHKCIYVLPVPAFALLWQSCLAVTEIPWPQNLKSLLLGAYRKNLSISAIEDGLRRSGLVKRSFVRKPSPNCGSCGQGLSRAEALLLDRRGRFQKGWNQQAWVTSCGGGMARGF